MKAKALEVRDAGTFIPVLCVDMNPSGPGADMERYLLARCGYACNDEPNIIMTRLDGSGPATNDPYGWPQRARTFPVAHAWIIEHWNELRDGHVVDVEFIMGLAKQPKRSEREGV